jgi:hypothetical protein
VRRIFKLYFAVAARPAPAPAMRGSVPSDACELRSGTCVAAAL